MNQVMNQVDERGGVQMRIQIVLSLALSTVCVPALAQSVPPTPGEQVPTPPSGEIRSEVAPAPITAPAPTPHKPALAGATTLSKWKTTLYGFAEYDAILDSVQGLNDGVGHAAIARDGTYSGSHARFTNAMRNSRIGFKLGGPDSGDIKTSAVLEMDFLGSQAAGTSESAVLTTPLFRARHLNFKVETPVVDILLGQTWQLFGAQPLFHPNTVEIQGVPGQIYSRSPQVRVSKAFKTDAIQVELALAAVRPAQRDGGMPDAQAALKLQLNGWKGLHTAGSTGTGVDPLTVAVSGIYRRFELPEFKASPKSTVTTNGWGLSVDALLPIMPATADAHGNALTLTGSFVTGQGIADLYSGLGAGVTNPSLPNPDNKPAAPVYTANIDPGLVAFSADGQLHAIQWQSWIAGVQYYLPRSGHVWVSANVARIESTKGNGASAHEGYAGNFTNGDGSKVFTKAEWVDLNLFWDVTPAVRLGAEAARFQTTYADGGKGVNLRGQFSAFYLF
jgi:hypothetical protein